MEVGGGDGHKYVAVWVPPEDQAVSNDKSCVLSEPQYLAGILGRNPHTRFLKFATEAEAWESLKDEDSGISSNPSTSMPPSSRDLSSTGPSPFAVKAVSYDGLLLPKKLTIDENDSTFATPTIQELTAIAREITAKNNTAVVTRVLANPRILINKCDRPTTVHEGCRHNALHMAAKCDNAEMISYILNKVGSAGFMSSLYPNKSEESIRDRIRYATDAYLNTPDKMANETPLHFACKFLCIKACKVLVRHPWCNFDAHNCFNQRALDIVGSRADPESNDFVSKKEKIVKLLTGTCIIPVWRDPDYIRLPKLGPVANIRELGNLIPRCLMEDFPDFDTSLLAPCLKHLLLDPKLCDYSFKMYDEFVQWRIEAFAGPVAEKEANELFKTLKQRRFGFVSEENANKPKIQSKSMSFSNRSTVNNNQAKLISGCYDAPSQEGRTPSKMPSLAHSYPNSPFFLNDTTPPNSPGFCSSTTVDDSINRNVKDIEKGLERYAMKISVSCNTEWWEEWKSLDYFGDILSDEGLQKFDWCLSSSLERQHIGHPKSMDANANTSSQPRLGLSELNLGSAGCTTPKKRTDDCKNSLCKLPNRYCTCNVPAFQFDPENPNFADKNYQQADCSVLSDVPDDHLSTMILAKNRLFASSDDSYGSDVDEDFFGVFDKITFLDGINPGKKDFQVFEALKDHEALIISDKFPYVFKWINAMKLAGGANYKDRRQFDLTCGKEEPETDLPQDFQPRFESTPKRLVFK